MDELQKKYGSMDGSPYDPELNKTPRCKTCGKPLTLEGWELEHDNAYGEDSKCNECITCISPNEMLEEMIRMYYDTIKGDHRHEKAERMMCVKIADDLGLTGLRTELYKDL